MNASKKAGYILIEVAIPSNITEKTGFFVIKKYIPEILKRKIR